MKQILFQISTLLLIIFQTDLAAQPAFNFLDFNTTGPGTRAKALGNSYIAIADDESGAYWNPAGISKINEFSRISLGGNLNANYIITDNQIDLESTFHGSLDYFLWGMNLSKFRLPLNFAFGYYKTIDFFNKFRIDSLDYEVKTMGGVNVFASSVAYNFSSNLFVGLSFNHYTGKYKLNDTGYLNSVDNLTGNNLALGIQYDKKIFSLGAVIKSPYKLKIEQEDSTFYIKMPLMFGVGAGFKISDQLIITGEIETRLFSNSSAEDENGHIIKYSINPDDEKIDWIDWNNCYIIRTGIEYIIQKNGFQLPVRFGILKKPSPLSDASKNQIQEWGLTCGTGIKTENIQIDFAAAYNMKSRRESGSALDEFITITENSYSLFTTITILWPN